MFNLRTAFRIIEVDGSAILSGEVSDDVHGIDTSGRFFGIFDEKLDIKLREDSGDFRFEGFESVDTMGVSLWIVFGVVVEEEVDHFGVDTRFAETVVFAILFGDIDKLLMRREFDVSVEVTGGEDNLRVRINVFSYLGTRRKGQKGDGAQKHGSPTSASHSTEGRRRTK